MRRERFIDVLSTPVCQLFIEHLLSPELCCKFRNQVASNSPFFVHSWTLIFFTISRSCYKHQSRYAFGCVSTRTPMELTMSPFARTGDLEAACFLQVYTFMHLTVKPCLKRDLVEFTFKIPFKMSKPANQPIPDTWTCHPDRWHDWRKNTFKALLRSQSNMVSLICAL